jgi:hypothetical protein
VNLAPGIEALRCERTEEGVPVRVPGFGGGKFGFGDELGDVDCKVADDVRSSDAALDNFAGSRELLDCSKFWGNRWRTQLSWAKTAVDSLVSALAFSALARHQRQRWLRIHLAVARLPRSCPR